MAGNTEIAGYSRSEQLTRQFYAWECRGRGWLVWDNPVYPEPPFEPFHYRVPHVLVEDDGRQHTVFSALADVTRRLEIAELRGDSQPTHL